MATLTRELSPASPVGTEVRPGKVVDNSAAQFLQDVSSTAVQARQTFDAIEGRTADAATSAAITEADEAFGISAVEQTISQELEPSARLKKGVAQGSANRDRFITDLDSRMRKLKARFPGHQDIIDKRARHLLGFDPRKATRDILFREETSAQDELSGLVTLGNNNGLTVWNDRAVGASSGINEVATANAAAAFLEGKRLAETSARAVTAAKAGGTNKEMTEAVVNLERSLEAQFNPQLQVLTDAFRVFHSSVTSPEEDLAFIRAGRTIKSNMLAAVDDSLSSLSTEESSRVKRTIEDRFEFLEKGLGTDIDAFSRLDETLAIADQLKANLKIVALEDMENISVINEVYGEASASIIGGQLLNSEIRKKVQQQVELETSGILEGDNIQGKQRAVAGRIALIHDIILSGRYGASSPHLSSADRTAIVEEAWEASVGFGTKILTDQEIPVWGNTWQALNDTYTSHIAEDPTNLPKLIDNIMSPTFNVNLATLKKMQPIRAASIQQFIGNILGDQITQTLLKDFGIRKFVAGQPFTLPTGVEINEDTGLLQRRAPSGVVVTEGTPTREDVVEGRRQTLRGEERFLTPLEEAAIRVKTFDFKDRPLAEFKQSIDIAIGEANRLALIAQEFGVPVGSTFERIFIDPKGPKIQKTEEKE